MVIQRIVIVIALSLSLTLSVVSGAETKYEKSNVILGSKYAMLNCTFDIDKEPRDNRFYLTLRLSGSAYRIVHVGTDGILKQTKDNQKRLGKKYELDIKPPRYSMRINNITRSDEGNGINCDVYDDDGRGARTRSREITIKVIEPPDVKLVPASEKIKRKLSSNDKDVEVVCSATGKPQPKLEWKRKKFDKNTVEPVDSKLVTVSTDGKSATLKLKAPLKVDDDGEYQCRAVSNRSLFPERYESIKAFNLSILYKPELTLSKSVVYTDLNKEETLQIDVRGNPMPTLTCSVLKLPGAKRVRLTPYIGHHGYKYDVKILKVEQKDIREYQCTASNSEGTIDKTVRLTLEPGIPQILSANSTSYSDYYRLHWKIQSGSAMQNVTVYIRGMGDSKFDRTTTFQLQSTQREFWHHIANLTDDTIFQLLLTACNLYSCTSKNSTIKFRTLKYEGGNTVNPLHVLIPITVPALKSAEVKDQGNNAVTLALSHTLLAVSGIFAATR